MDILLADEQEDMVDKYLERGVMLDLRPNAWSQKKRMELMK